MKDPGDIPIGSKKIKQWSKNFRAWAKSLQPLAGPGILVSDEQDGKTISAEGVVAGTSTPPHAFQLVDASTGTEGSKEFKIRVIYGTLAGEAPSGMSPGDDPPYILTVSGTGYVWGGITRDADSGDITSRFIDFGSSVPSDSETNGYVELGSFSISDGTMSLATAVAGSQAHGYCFGHEWGLQ